MDYYIRSLWNSELQDYQCSPNFVATERYRQPVIGWICIVYGIITNVLYLLCIMAMLDKRIRRLSCYRIMTYLGVIDIITIFINSVAAGYFFILGAEYCTFPNFTYISGCLGLSLWCCSCLSCLLLVLNRLHALWDKSQGISLKYANYSLLIPTLYFLFFFIFTKPVIHNSQRFGWFFSPFIKGKDNIDYSNIAHTINNFLMVFLTVFCYVGFAIVLRERYKKHSQAFHISKHPVILQAVLMCTVNTLASLIYVFMQFLPVPNWFVLFGHANWQFGHGCPAYIYLILNKTIRYRILYILRIRTPPHVLVERSGGKPLRSPLPELNLPKLLTNTNKVNIIM